MSGSDVPYQLRPNKHVERELFADLLARIDRTRPMNRYVYISMGGRFLEDHKSLRGIFEFRKCVSIDQSEIVVGRQSFNKPFETIDCRCSSSADFVKDFSQFASDFAEDTNFIVWLDYTDPGQRLGQLQEFSSLISKSNEGDICKITLNANVQTLAGDDAKLPTQFKSITERRLAVLHSQLSMYPSGATEKEMRQPQFPAVLARSIGAAAKKGVEAHDQLVVRPLAVFSYSDGAHPMLCVTCMILRSSEADAFCESLSGTGWSHLPADWGDVTRISVPDLSVKEKLHIDRMLFTHDDAAIAASLNFQFDQDSKTSSERIQQYRQLYRYYPQFVRAAP